MKNDGFDVTDTSGEDLFDSSESIADLFPEFPAGQESFEEWGEPVLAMLAQILEAHQAKLADEELMLAQKTIGRVREVFQAALRLELLVNKYREIETSMGKLDEFSHMQEHMLASVAKRAGGAVLLLQSEMSELDCDDFDQIVLELARDEKGYVYYLKEGFQTEDQVEAWAKEDFRIRKGE